MEPYRTSNKPKAVIQHRPDTTMNVVVAVAPQEAAIRTTAEALIRRKMTTLERFAVSMRPVCPSDTRVITARSMVPMAPTVSACSADAIGIEAPATETVTGYRRDVADRNPLNVISTRSAKRWTTQWPVSRQQRL